MLWNWLNFYIMKYIFLLLFTPLTIFHSFSQNDTNNKASTYYLIRHAEKDRTNADNKDPHLTEKGLLRAENWAKTLKHVQFDAVYSTNFNRTIETAQPIADSQQLKITYYDPRINLKHFLKETRGKKVLVVGHSNTIPNLVNSLIGKKKYDLIEDTNNSNLYIVIKQLEFIVDQILVVD